MLPIAENLYTNKPSLLGSNCAACGEIYFPARVSCSNCSSEDMQPQDLGQKGTLWSWTIQKFIPKPPYNSGETAETFQAFGVGYVELECGVKVKSRLIAPDLNCLKIGDSMSLIVTPFRSAGSEPVSTFAFKRDKQP